MTDSNSEFCFSVTLNVPRGEAEGDIEVEEKPTSLFPAGPVIKCSVMIPLGSNVEKEKTAKKSFTFDRLANKFVAVGASPVTCESKVSVIVSLGS